MKNHASIVRSVALTVFLIITTTLLANCVPENKVVEVSQEVATAVPTILPTPTTTLVPSITMEPILEQPAETATAVAQPIIAPVIIWQYEDNQRCLQARIGREWVEAGNCEGETAVYALPEQHRAELESFLDTFYSFSADTRAGHVTFNGSNRGLNAVPFPAQERMLAYWARVVYEELLTGTSPTWNQAFVWQRAENGRCQQLQLTLTGIATALSCDNGELVELAWDMLGAEDLAKFYEWTDTFAVTNTADFNLVGNGKEPIDPDHEMAIGYFAEDLFAWLVVNSVQADEATIEPLAKAGYFTVAGWSADSRWLAYWASTQADVDMQQPYAMPGGMLHFADTTTGEICAVDTLHTETDQEAAVYWQPDNQVVVVLPSGTFTGQPCKPFALLADFVPPQPEAGSDSALSPDGRFRAHSAESMNENGTVSVTTTIVDTQSGANVTTLTWQHPGGLGGLGLGGTWVTPTQFLIHGTLSEGPLLIDMEKGILSVLTDLPGLSLTPPDEEDEYSLWAMAAPGQEQNNFSMVIYGLGVEAASPSVVLYHSDAALAETLPFRHVWGFSQTDEWLFLYESVETSGYQSGNHIWGRRLADIGGEWQLVAPSVGYVTWREDGSEMAFTQNGNRVVWQTFPALEQIGEWHTGQYWIYPVSFSPDARFLVVQGNLPGTWHYGLYLLER